MRKLLVSFLAAFMLLSVAGTALAWEETELTAVIYSETSSVEIGFDLGDITTMDFSASNVVLMEDAYTLEDFSVTDWSDLSVGIFSIDGYVTYFGSSIDSVPAITTTMFGNFRTSAGIVANAYGDGTTGTMTYGDLNSYGQALNQQTYAPGSYGAFNEDWTQGEATFVDGVDYVDLYLYSFDIYDIMTGGDMTTDYTAIVRFYTDGTIVLNPTEVPLPGAFILLGSGLLGLAGIRRKNS